VPNLTDSIKRGKRGGKDTNSVGSIPAMFWRQESLGMGHAMWKARMLRCAESGVEKN
jgi:hypothetical protein